MPKIKLVRPIGALSKDLPERIDNPSPDGEWNLIVHTPREFHMGADGWRVKLFHRGHNITAKHNDFFRIADGKGFRWERHFQPWSLDSKSLAMVTWDKTPIHLYQIAAKRDKPLNYQPRFVRSAQWAPDIDRLLLTFTIDGVLVNQAGEQQALVRGGIEEGQTMHTYWMKAGKCFFILARQANNFKTTLRFYSGLDGALQETHDLDPMDLVPYNWEDFLEMPRDRLCLEVVDPATGAEGSMLDIWNSVLFDQASSSLLLAVFRPVSSPYREKGELLCKVKQTWIAVELDPD